MSSSGGGGGAPKSPFGFHESARELDQIRRRREIRMKLQAEFNRVFYNPHRHSQHIEILDPVVSRYTAMRASIYEHWKPNWPSFWKYAFWTQIPIMLGALRLHYLFKEKDEECRRGDYPYEKRDIRRI